MAFQSHYRSETDSSAIEQIASPFCGSVQDASGLKLRRPEVAARLLQPEVQAERLEQVAAIDLQSVSDGVYEDGRAKDGQP